MISVHRYLYWRGIRKCFQNIFLKKEINMEQALDMVNESKKQIERMDIICGNYAKDEQFRYKGVSGRRNYQ